jgi:competence CoiA-like predicted nuclease
MPIVSKYKGYTAYYVETIPRPKKNKSQIYNVPFTPSDKQTKTSRPTNNLIRKIDGQSFYALVTGVPDALEQLYDAIPIVIGNLSNYTFQPNELVIMKTYFKKAFV